MQYWKQEDDGRFRRIDGAVVTADSTDPERPWTATGPGNQVLSIIILSKSSARTWRYARQAIDAVDRHMPLTEALGSSSEASSAGRNRRQAESIPVRDRLISRARTLSQSFEWRLPSLITDRF